MMKRVRALLLILGCACAASPVVADGLSDLADKCNAALRASDQSGFETVLEEVLPRKDVFDVAARKRLEACLSEGKGEPWEYSFPDRAWLPVAEAKALQASRDAELADQSKAKLEAALARQANAERVADLVYASCTDLLTRDPALAMTNPVCIDTFLTNGLPER